LVDQFATVGGRVNAQRGRANSKPAVNRWIVSSPAAGQVDSNLSTGKVDVSASEPFPLQRISWASDRASNQALVGFPPFQRHHLQRHRFTSMPHAPLQRHFNSYGTLDNKLQISLAVFGAACCCWLVWLNSKGFWSPLLNHSVDLSIIVDSGKHNPKPIGWTTLQDKDMQH